MSEATVSKVLVLAFCTSDNCVNGGFYIETFVFQGHSCVWLTCSDSTLASFQLILRRLWLVSLGVWLFLPIPENVIQRFLQTPNVPYMGENLQYCNKRQANYESMMGYFLIPGATRLQARNLFSVYWLYTHLYMMKDIDLLILLRKGD